LNIGFVGLGKLGLPCALAVESKGHNVVGYDTDEKVTKYLEEGSIPYREIWVEKYLPNTTIRCVPLETVVSKSEIIFVAV
jgi:UDPglucose 6-dehydrogenase